jgi:hypothetical protein
MCPKDYQPSAEPNRTPDKAEGSEEAVQGALRAKGMATGDKDQQVGQSGKAPAGSEPNRTPGKAEG